MKIIRNLFSLVIGLALIAAFVLGAYLGIKYVLGLYSGLDKQLEAVLTIATVVILLTATIIGNSIRVSKRYSIDGWAVKEKRDIYDRLIGTWTDALEQAENEREPIPAAPGAGEEADKINRDMLLLADNTVLNRFVSFKSMEHEYGYEDPKVREEIGKMLMEFRKDLGRKNWNLKEKDLLELIHTKR